ncbi:hypothetical protein PFISCL1PPCAC_3903, partial [Pristionchus fissidentatus]
FVVDNSQRSWAGLKNRHSSNNGEIGNMGQESVVEQTVIEELNTELRNSEVSTCDLHNSESFFVTCAIFALENI